MTGSARWGAVARAGPFTVMSDDGTELTYEARWSQLELPDSDGEIDATISGTAYVVPGQRRPVTFLWNGGPGASSSPLHMRAFGPRILDGEIPVPNPHTLLSVSDLVFVDPVGTGFSRAVSDAARARFFTVPGDAAAAEVFVRHWLETYGDVRTSVHIVGESYGGYRTAAVLPRLLDLPVASVTLISPMLDRASTADGQGHHLHHVFALPTMAVAAWAHGKTQADVTDVAMVWRSAQRFAADELLPALYHGPALEERRRRHVAERVAALLALPLETVIDADLRVDSEEFLRTLRAEDDLLVGRLDVRVTGARPEPVPAGRPPAADDPALGIGRSNVVHSDAIAVHLRNDVGAGGDERYVSLSLDVNFAWDWEPQPDQPGRPEPPQISTTLAPNLGAFVAARPATRVAVIGGYFDLATTLASTAHAVRHSGVPAANLEIVPLATGHSIDAAVLPDARAAIARTITGQRA